MRKTTSAFLFTIASSAVIILGTLSAISGLFLFVPIGSKFPVHSITYLIYLFALPAFILLALARIIVFKKRIYFKTELVTTLVTSAISLFLLFMPYEIYEIIGNNLVVNKVIVPAIYLIPFALTITNIVFLCIDIQKTGEKIMLQ